MRYRDGRKEQTRERILAAAGSCFRRAGYAGIGVDGLAKEAGVTSGAFYAHFGSKRAAFEAALAGGMQELGAAIAAFRAEHGENWWQAFAAFYLSEKRTCNPAQSCALQSLAPEVMRGDDALKLVFENELRKVASLAADSGEGPGQAASAWPQLAMLIGAVTLARAVGSEALSSEIAEAVRLAIGAGGTASKGN